MEAEYISTNLQEQGGGVFKVVLMIVELSWWAIQWSYGRVVEHRLRRMTSVAKNQFGFMPGRSTMEAIFLVWQLMERYREQKKDLYMVFIDLEKAYDKIPRNVMWWALEKHKVPTKYITLIKDMYDNVVTHVRTSDINTDDFSMKIGLHQGSALSPYLFPLVYAVCGWCGASRW